MLHALDRQKIILNNLKIDSVTSINHLIQKTKFHESTIRRDLKILAVNQKIVIVRGGVIPLKEIDKKPNIIKNLEQKQKIAKYAAGLIKENDSIIINGGSTCSLIPDYLENKFLSCLSINEIGLLEDDENLAKFVTGLINISDEIILLVDDTKFYKNDGSFIVCPLESINTIVTNNLSSKVQNFQKVCLKAVTIPD